MVHPKISEFICFSKMHSLTIIFHVYNIVVLKCSNPLIRFWGCLVAPVSYAVAAPRKVGGPRVVSKVKLEIFVFNVWLICWPVMMEMKVSLQSTDLRKFQSLDIPRNDQMRFAKVRSGDVHQSIVDEHFSSSHETGLKPVNVVIKKQLSW